jgi:hypothetical protein
MAPREIERPVITSPPIDTQQPISKRNLTMNSVITAPMDGINTIPSLNPFDPAALRLDQSYTSIGVKKLVTTVPVRKPSKQDFVRVNPDPAFRLSPAAIIELREERGEVYLVTPAMAVNLPGEYVPATLYTAINRQGVLQIWPVKLPGPDGKVLEWHRSAAEAAERAMERWVRVTANMSLGAYEMFVAQEGLPEPVWPDLTFTEILKVAFMDRYVDDVSHPLVKRLRGEA